VRPLIALDVTTMIAPPISRRTFLNRSARGTTAALAAASCSALPPTSSLAASEAAEREGSQRLRVEDLKKWEDLRYGMFLCFGMSTFLEEELPDGKAPLTAYAPDRLDVDQWISVARDAGMKYAMLTAKHVDGHCLWPSEATERTVANSPDTTDVVEKYVEACQKRGVLPGLYYCSWDNHHRFGSKTPSDSGGEFPPYTTSLYQDFQTAQITELLTQYGDIAETWIDIPGVLGRGYRTYLYEYVAGLQPQTVIMMNSGIITGEEYPVDYAWPSDLIAIERRLPPGSGHEKWRTIEGKEYCMPGEVCDPIGKDWFHVNGDAPRSDQELHDQFAACRDRGVSLLLSVPPDKHGLIPEESISALERLKEKARD
jgi:alpha-L-fucosidase